MTASSSATRPSPSSAAATPRSRRRSSSPGSRRPSRSCTGATSSARRRSWQERALREPEDRLPVERGGRGGRRQRDRRRRPAARHGHRRHVDVAGAGTVRRHRTRPDDEALRGSTRARRERLRRRPSPTRPVRRSTACSRPATCRTTCTVRRSPRPGPGCMAAIEAERWLEARHHDAGTAGVTVG